MCILFSYISKLVKPNEFKLIILNNRDEFFFRACKPASYVTEDNIYGTDLTPGKEGGTWLGVSRLGKVGVLLNLDRHEYENSENKEGRGFFVPNYLNANFNFRKYIEPIKENADRYNPFILIGYEKNTSDLWDATLFDNVSREVTKFDSEFLSISNHLYEKPYTKTVVGEKMFKDIIGKINDTNKKQELMDGLLSLAKYDANLKLNESMSEKDVTEMMRSQVFINVPGYGTRTHTLILVDDKNRVTYRERTMKCPIDDKNPPKDCDWLDNVYEFQL